MVKPTRDELLRCIEDYEDAARADEMKGALDTISRYEVAINYQEARAELMAVIDRLFKRQPA